MEPFIGQISVFPFGFAPRGWAQCNGQLLPINQNQALFSLLGTQFGGNGTTNFALPNLQSRTPLHFGNGYVIGQASGEENHTLTQPEMPMHTHTPIASSNAADQSTPANNFWGAQGQSIYAGTANATMNPAAIGNTGGSTAHNNMAPYLALNFCIALQGVFPSQN